MKWSLKSDRDEFRSRMGWDEELGAAFYNWLNEGGFAQVEQEHAQLMDWLAAQMEREERERLVNVSDDILTMQRTDELAFSLEDNFGGLKFRR